MELFRLIFLAEIRYPETPRGRAPHDGTSVFAGELLYQAPSRLASDPHWHRFVTVGGGRDLEPGRRHDW